MQKRTREILALVLLAVLLVVGVVAMGYYILVGHNWNVAASNIDDRIGQMEGYSVILFEGTRVEEGDGAARGSSSSRNPADVAGIASDYRDKGATVFVVDASDLSRYTEPFVVGKNGVRVGFLGVRNSELRSQVRADIKYLAEGDANYIVAITDDQALDDLTAEGSINGLSVIVCDDPNGDSAHDQYRGSAYCVTAPEVGKVGAVIISPSGVFSAKVIDGAADEESPPSSATSEDVPAAGQKSSSASSSQP